MTMNFTDTEKRQMFEFAIKNVFAIDFKENYDSDTPVFIMFNGIDLPRKAATYLNEYSGTGFSLIIQKEAADSVTLKIYDVDNDEIFTSNNVMTTKMAIDRIDFSSINKKYLSIGQILSSSDIEYNDSVKVPLLSISAK
jgi:hypothetical protein